MKDEKEVDIGDDDDAGCQIGVKLVRMEISKSVC